MNSIENCSQTLSKILKVCFYRFMSLYNKLQSLFLVPTPFIFLFLWNSGYQFPCLLKLSTHWCIIMFRIVIVVATVCSLFQRNCCIPRQFQRGFSSCFGQLYFNKYTVMTVSKDPLHGPIWMIQNTNWEQHKIIWNTYY